MGSCKVFKTLQLGNGNPVETLHCNVSRNEFIYQRRKGVALQRLYWF